MTGKPVKRLFDLEIDEVSLVDRAANQHARVAIAKNDTSREERDMPVIFDEGGSVVTEDDLEHGGTYFDEQGNEYVFIDEDQIDDDDDEDGYEFGQYAEDDEDELVGVGKFFAGPVSRSKGVRMMAADAGGYKNLAGQAGNKSKDWVKNNKKKAAGIGAATVTTTGLGGYAAGRRKEPAVKSLGNQVLEELSKALDQGERDEVIGKAMDVVSKAEARAVRAERIAKSLAEQREMDEYVELAKSYELPADPGVLGRVLKAAAAVMDEEELDLFDAILHAAAERDIYAELGSAGSYQASSVMDEVSALAGQAVGKFDLTPESAVVAMFEANPAAYDEYLSER